jgi:hypothetical protein
MWQVWGLWEMFRVQQETWEPASYVYSCPEPGESTQHFHVTFFSDSLFILSCHLCLGLSNWLSVWAKLGDVCELWCPRYEKSILCPNIFLVICFQILCVASQPKLSLDRYVLGFLITLTHTHTHTHTVGLLWTSVQSVAEVLSYTTNTGDENQCCRRDQNPLFQHSSGRKSVLRRHHHRNWLSDI